MRELVNWQPKHRQRRPGRDHGDLGETMETTERAWRPRRQGGDHGDKGDQGETRERSWRPERNRGDQAETTETRERPWRQGRDHGDQGETRETKERPWRPGRDHARDIEKLLASEFGITVSEVVQVIQTRYHHGYTSMSPEDSSDANNTFVLKEA